MQCGWDRCWDSEYRSLADAMVSEGLAKAGYAWLMLDDCWVAGRNETTGELCVTLCPSLPGPFQMLFARARVGGTQVRGGVDMLRGVLLSCHYFYSEN